MRYLAKSALPEPAARRESQKGYECSTSFETCAVKPGGTAPGRTSETCVSTFDDSRSLSSSSCRTALPVCRHRAPCKPSNVIGTSVSLRRIDRACYQDRCDVHSDTSDDTDSPTRRAAKTLSRRATRSRPHSKPVEPSAWNRRWRAGHGPGRRSWLENASRGCRVGPRRASGEKVCSG